MENKKNYYASTDTHSLEELLAIINRHAYEAVNQSSIQYLTCLRDILRGVRNESLAEWDFYSEEVIMQNTLKMSENLLKELSDINVFISKDTRSEYDKAKDLTESLMDRISYSPNVLAEYLNSAVDKLHTSGRFYKHPYLVRTVQLVCEEYLGMNHSEGLPDGFSHYVPKNRKVRNAFWSIAEARDPRDLPAQLFTITNLLDYGWNIFNK